MMKRRWRGLFYLLPLFVLLPNPFFILNQAGAETHFMDALGIVKLEEKPKAPDFTLKDLNGKEVKLTDHRGKIVFINFWATWCPPCRIEMPSMEKLYTEFKDKDFVILAIDLQESAGRVKAFKEDFKLNFLILLDSTGEVGLNYGVMSIPTTYLVDRDGHLIGGALGPRDWASKEAFELIDHLLNSASAS